MEQSYELRLIDIRKSALEQSQNAELYIPLHGKHTTNSEEEPFDLAEKIQSFFVFKEELTDPKVMLLMGGTGSGKSVFSQQLHQQLWGAYKTGDPIPLWIPLPELQNPFEGAVEEVLKKYGFSEAQIIEIKVKERFTFIVDGYDELHQFQNCYVTNKWEKWAAKILMTCRSQALYYQQDPDKYFVPFNGEKRLPLLLRKLYVAAFSEEQIGSYVKQYQQLNTEHKISDEDFTKVPGLTELIKTPFLLHLAVEALPDILGGQVDDKKITQAKLYDVFIERWFSRQVKKLSAAGLLKDTEQKTKQQFWDYCKSLAQKMHEKEVSVIPYQGQKVGGRLFGKPAQKSPWDSFFTEEMELARSACPLRRYGEHHYGFVHASMVEYFATREMYEEIQNNHHTEDAQYLEEKGKEDGDNRIESVRDKNQPHAGIHQRLFSLERQSIQFLADRIEMSEAFKQKMLTIIDASKKSERYAIGAANAITALVRAGVTFNGANLSGIKISGADISGGYFDQANIANADLSNVQMFRVWLREASFEGSQVKGVDFGESISFQFPNEMITFDYCENVQRLAVACKEETFIYDLFTGKELRKISYSDQIGTPLCLQFSQKGESLVVGYKDKIRIWNVETGYQKEFVVHTSLTGSIECMIFSLDQARLALGSDDKTVRIWDVASGSELAVLSGHKEKVTCVAFSPDGYKIVSGSYDSTLRIWEVQSGKMLAVLKGEGDKGSIICTEFSSDGERIISVSGYAIWVWNVLNAEGALLINIKSRVSNHYVYVLGISPDWTQIACKFDDNTVKIVDVQAGEIIAKFYGHTQDVSKVVFSLDGQQVLSGSTRYDAGSAIMHWNINSRNFTARDRGHEKTVACVSLSQNGMWALSGSQDSTVSIWEVASGQLMARLKHKSEVGCVSFSPDSKNIVSGGSCINGNGILIWNVAKREVVRVLQLDENESVRSVQYSPDGKRLVSSTYDYTDTFAGKVYIWGMVNGKKIIEHREAEEDKIVSVAFSPDGKQIVFGGHTGFVKVLEASSGKIINTLRFGYPVLSVAFSPNGKDVLIGCYDGHVRIWEVSSEKEKAIYKQHFSKVVRAVFNEDGEYFWAGTQDGLVAWAVNNNVLRQASLSWTTELVDFAYHNKKIIVGLEDGTVECWKLEERRLRLCWTTNIESRAINVSELNMSKVIGLSDQNRLVLEKKYADFSPNKKIDANIAQQTGSPIYSKSEKSTYAVEQVEESDYEENSDNPKVERRCCIIN